MTAARWQAIDVLRGIAILMMVIFHIGWDLYYFGWSATDVTTDPGWVIFQKLTLGSFVVIAGATLVLAHGNGIRWPKFWRRFGVLVAAALAVTAGTYFMFPDYFVFFGVLHALALFSLLALPFLRLDGRVTLGVAVAVIVASLFWSAPIFRERWLAWIGFWPLSPETADIVPIFPWFGVELLGVVGMQALRHHPLAVRLSGWRAKPLPLRALRLAGRWSLPVYLIHQPILIGIMTLILQVSPVQQSSIEREISFATGCQASCQRSENSAAQDCVAYCSCALDQVREKDLWAALSTPNPALEQQKQITEVSKLCTAMSAKAAPGP